MPEQPYIETLPAYSCVEELSGQPIRSIVASEFQAMAAPHRSLAKTEMLEADHVCVVPVFVQRKMSIRLEDPTGSAWATSMSPDDVRTIAVVGVDSSDEVIDGPDRVPPSKGEVSVE